jgi:peptidoglycan hydrolase-like protein with peptidoglycan-binding domain
MNRTSTLTATALAAMLAGTPVAAFAWSNNSASNTTGSPSTSTQSYNGTSGSSSMTGQGMPSQQLSQNEVQDAQQKLQQEGFYKNGQIDGVVGPQTRQALQQFQQSKGLPSTGQLDQQTLAALDQNGQGSQNPSSTMNNGTMQGAGNSGQGTEGGTGHQGG